MSSTTKYSNIDALLNSLNDKTRRLEEIAVDLRTITSWSCSTSNRAEMHSAQAMHFILPFLDLKPTKNKQGVTLEIRELSAAIFVNLAYDTRGSMELSRCDGWNCISYRHQCPTFRLLVNASDGPSVSLRQASLAALLNISITIQGKLHIQSVGGIGSLLKLRSAAVTEVVFYTAAILWNILKLPSIVLALETRFSILKSSLEKELTYVLDSALSDFELQVTPSDTRGVPGTIDPTSCDNLAVALTARASSSLKLSLGVKTFDDDKLMQKQYISENTNNTKVDTKRYHNGMVYTVCPVCFRKCEEDDDIVLECKSSPSECTTKYHLECSRWKKLSKKHVDASVFYCNECVKSEYVQLPDLRLKLLECDQSLSDLVSSEKTLVGKYNILRQSIDDDDHHLLTPSPASYALITSDKKTCLGVARVLYYLEEKDNDSDSSQYAIYQLCFKFKQMSAMFHEDTVYDCDEYNNNIKDDVMILNQNGDDISVNNLIVWKQQNAREIKTNFDLTKEMLNDAVLYTFTSSRNNDLAYSFGSRLPLNEDQQVLLYYPVLTSRAKISKILLDSIRAHKKKSKKTKTTKKERAAAVRVAKAAREQQRHDH